MLIHKKKQNIATKYTAQIFTLQLSAASNSASSPKKEGSHFPNLPNHELFLGKASVFEILNVGESGEVELGVKV